MTDEVLANRLQHLARDPMWDHYASVNVELLTSAAAALRRVTDEAMPMFGRPIANWHDKFAWFPVDTYDQGIKWFQFVERRRIQSNQDRGPYRWWQYRAVRTAKKET